MDSLPYVLRSQTEVRPRIYKENKVSKSNVELPLEIQQPSESMEERSVKIQTASYAMKTQVEKEESGRSDNVIQSVTVV